MVFLTDLDPRAAVRGSRDPLGVVPLWSHFGRSVVGTLTTVTNSLRGFTTVLLGYYFAQEVREQDPRGEPTLSLFLKFEQLAGHSRWLVHKDNQIRGIERVKRNLDAASTIHLSARPEDQILGNQKVYGLWGLYSASARAAGLLRHDEPILTPVARDFVERCYIPMLAKEGFKGSAVVELLRQPRAEVQLKGRHAALTRVVSRMMSPKCSIAEAEFYRDHLVFGLPPDATGGLQRELAELMRSALPADTEFNRGELGDLIKKSSRPKGNPALSEKLLRIDQLESLLAPAASLFGFLLGRERQTIADVASELADTWGKRVPQVDVDAIRSLQPEIQQALHDPASAARWIDIAGAAATGDYGAFVQHVLDHNAYLMGLRGGSKPWMRLSKGAIEVLYREQPGRLPDKKGLPHLWVNSYFLNSLKTMTTTLAA